jgi:hypothetical protein
LSPAAAGGDDTDRIVEPTTWAALAYNGFMWWASAGEKRHSDEVDELSRDAALLADLGGGPRPGVVSPVVGQRRGSVTSSAAAGAGGGGGAGGSSGVVSSLAPLAAAGRGTTTSTTTGHDGNDDDEAEEEEQEDKQARIELAVVAYFHRLTSGVMSVLADIVDSSDDDDLLGLDLDSNAEGGFDGAASLGGDDEEEEEARLLGATTAGSSTGDGGRRGWVRVDSEALAEMGLDVWSQADADFVREVAVRYFGRRAYVETKGVEVCGVRVC